MKIFYLCSTLVCLVFYSRAQNVTISGYVTDVASGEALINANVYNTDRQKGAVSNVYGFYSITLPAGKTSLQYSFVGYEKQIVQIDLKEDSSLFH